MSGHTETLRSEQRRGRRQRVLVRCRLDDGRVERFAWLVELSAGGARIVTAAPPPVGQQLELTFALPEHAPLVCRGARVVWRAVGHWGRGGVMGLAFADEQAEHAVTEYLEG